MDGKIAVASLGREAGSMGRIAGVVSEKPVDDELQRRLRERASPIGSPRGTEHRTRHVMLVHDVHGLHMGTASASSEKGDLVLFADADLENAAALRADLAARGHHCPVGANAALMLRLIEEHGAAGLARVRGGFACALHDVARGTVSLMRDPLGRKPLFLAARAGATWFSSDLRSLAHALGAEAPDLQALSDFLCFGFVPGEQTAVRGIERVAAGRQVVIAERAAGTCTVPRIEQAGDSREHDVVGADDIVGLLRGHIDDVLGAAAAARGPIAVSLDGSLGARVVAARAVRAFGPRLVAYAAAPDPRGGERRDDVAGRVGRHLGVNVRHVPLSSPDAIERLPDLLHVVGEPVASLCALETAALLDAARADGCAHVVVGLGGDELFWEHRWAQRAARRALVRAWLPGATAEPVRSAALAVPGLAFAREARPRYLTRAALAGAPRDALDALDPFDAVDAVDTISPLATAPARADTAILRALRHWVRDSASAVVQRLSSAAGSTCTMPLFSQDVLAALAQHRRRHIDALLPAGAWLREAGSDALPLSLLRGTKEPQPHMRRWHRALFMRYGGLLDDGALVQHGVLDSAAALALAEGPWPAREGASSIALKALVLELWLRGLVGAPLAQRAPRTEPQRATQPAAQPHNARAASAAQPAPIAVMAFRRPRHLHRTLTSLAACAGIEHSEVTVYCDGPRNDAERADTEAVRAVARGFHRARRTRVVERDTNWGLARSIEAAVRQQCDEAGNVIVVEDDLEVSPAFLTFMNAALARYQDEPRVLQVAGFMHAPLPGAPRAVLLPLTSSWGWATWGRAWDLYDHDMRAAPLLDDPARAWAFDLDGAYPYTAMLKRERAFLQDSWAIRWYLSLFAHQGLVVAPSRSLVSNHGFDGSGTHTRGSAAPVALLPMAPALFPMQVAVDESALHAVRIALLRSKRARLPDVARRIARSARAAGTRALEHAMAASDPVAHIASIVERLRR